MGLEASAQVTSAHPIACDFVVKDAVFALFAQAAAHMGGVHIMANAVATGQYRPFEPTSEAEIHEMLSIIFKGGFFFMQAAVRAIVTLTSQVAPLFAVLDKCFMTAQTSYTTGGITLRRPPTVDEIGASIMAASA